ncbi:cathelicidin-3-like [Moschus berezovskii]|uniref:cathelicidin-3-like n=1 Tax=Moschus berezovskii TaxID=68408 RepID=UPI0024445BDF|nr:cathelicidin-3-like [Moschus berezovskii]
METQRASLSLGQWSLWLLLLGLVLPSASAQALSYREAVLRAVDQLNEKSSEANLYRLLELDPPPKDVEDRGTRKPVSFRVKETACPRMSQQPLEQCDFKENGLVKQCVATVSLYQSDDQFNLNCNELQSVRRLHPRSQRFPRERPWPKPLPLPLPRPGPRPWPKPLPLPLPRPGPRAWPKPL